MEETGTALIDKLMLQAIEADPTLVDDPARLAARVTALAALRREVLKRVVIDDETGDDGVMGPKWRQGRSPMESVRRLGE